MGKCTSDKRSFSRAGRRQELDNSNKTRRVLWSYCRHHKDSYYFYDVRKRRWSLNEAAKWEDEPDMKKVLGQCMACGRRSVFFAGADELEEHRYGNVTLCPCRLPAFHEQPSPEFCAQYNARPVPCRPSPNGQAHI